MTDEQKIAPELMEAFERLMRYAPPEVANDEQVKNKLLVYLKLGGERLARQYLQMVQKIFPDKIILIKKRPPEESEEDTGNTEDTDCDENKSGDIKAVEEDDSFDVN